MFGGGIAGITLFRTEPAPTANASLELRTDFLAGLLLDRIGATGRQCRKDKREEKRPASRHKGSRLAQPAGAPSFLWSSPITSVTSLINGAAPQRGVRRPGPHPLILGTKHGNANR